MVRDAIPAPWPRRGPRAAFRSAGGLVGIACVPKKVVLSGPLAEYGAGFVAQLQRLGFAPLSAEHQLRLLAI